MRKVLLIASVAALTLGSSAALADWHTPYIYRESNGGWTHYTYDDGICHYSYERYSSGQAQTYSSGDCSHVSFVAPDGGAPLYAPDTGQ